eukprot:scaffold47328_cov17-Tisochrysis_lutea.AAC.1
MAEFAHKGALPAGDMAKPKRHAGVPKMAAKHAGPQQNAEQVEQDVLAAARAILGRDDVGPREPLMSGACIWWQQPQQFMRASSSFSHVRYQEPLCQ